MTKFYLIAYEIYLKIVFLTNLIKPNTRKLLFVYTSKSRRLYKPNYCSGLHHHIFFFNQSINESEINRKVA